MRKGLAGLEALVAGAMTTGASGLRREQQGEGRDGQCLTSAGGGLTGVGKAAALVGEGGGGAGSRMLGSASP